MELEVQKYLRSGKSLINLEIEYGIHCRTHVDYPNLIGLKYHMLDSPKGDKIVNECRGLVLDCADNYKIISFPFVRFFNLGDGNAANIDWDSATVQEKADGSLITLYCYDDKWHVSTSGSPAASGPVTNQYKDWNCNGFTLPIPNSFAEYFWQVMYSYYSDSDSFEIFSKDYCYMFELMGPLNRIVVPHSIPKIVCLGSRNLKTLEEISSKETSKVLLYNIVPSIKEFDLHDINNILSTFTNMSPLFQEGYVVVDKYFNRVKIKNPGYVALHHAKDGMTEKAFLEIARHGEVPEVIIAFPEFKPMLEEANKRYSKLVLELEETYEGIKDIKIQKEFALEAIKTKCSGALFQLRSGKVKSIREFLMNMSIVKLMEMV